MQPPDQPKPELEPDQDQSQSASDAESYDTEPATQPSDQAVAEDPTTPVESEPQSTPVQPETPVTPTTETQTSPVDQPASTVPPVVPASAPVAPAPKKRKAPLLIIILVVILAVIGGGIAAGLAWYQNPDKVVTDSIINSLSAKQAIVTGTLGMNNDDVSIDVALDAKGKENEGSVAAVITIKAKSGELADKDLKINADAISTKDGDVYFKVSNLEAAVNSYIDTMIESQVKVYQNIGYTLTPADIAKMRMEAKSQFASILSKVDDQWIKVSADELKDENDESSACVAAAVEKITTDRAVAKEVLDVYENNRFIVVKESLGTKDGSMGYLLSLNEDTAKGFGKQVQDTTFGKDLEKCDANIFKDTDSTVDKSDSDLKNARFELWVDQWTHKITRVVFNGEIDDTSSINLTTDLKFDYMTNVEAPKVPADVKSIKELQADIEGVLAPAMTVSSQT